MRIVLESLQVKPLCLKFQGSVAPHFQAKRSKCRFIPTRTVASACSHKPLSVPCLKQANNLTLWVFDMGPWRNFAFLVFFYSMDVWPGIREAKSRPDMDTVGVREEINYILYDQLYLFVCLLTYCDLIQLLSVFYNLE